MKQLCRLDVEVLAIDKESQKVEAISQECEDAITIDVSNEEVIREHLENVDVLVVTVGETPLPGILLTTIAQELDIRRIVIRAHEPTARAILEKLGATEIFSPEKKAAESMARNLTVPFSVDSLPLSTNQAIVKIDAPEDWIGKTVKEIGIRQNFAVNLICIARNDGTDHDFAPAIDKPFVKTDVLFLLGSRDRLEKLTGSLK